MGQEIKADMKEIITKLARLQTDMDYIKEKISLEEEMHTWEKISEEDASAWEKENLKDE